MESFMSSISCAGTECLSWLLVLANILAVFYLVFCSFWRVTRVVKLIGWIWIGGLVCATVGVLMRHTCVYTLLVTVFTGMMIIAILAVILQQPRVSSGAACGVSVTKSMGPKYTFSVEGDKKRVTVSLRRSTLTVRRDNGER